ncbi:peptidase C39 family protein [Rothia sp. AR01]|uniref:Peptidase C39 family protein n=1 Tax=Rothia santali TaxID=2949643 RepID=A0A9X2HCR9_9MICC|nr:peptidase C39 family protein [Rothia santali]MCP3424729.1 peptidase C39 family protein [Rothia santali]
MPPRDRTPPGRLVAVPFDAAAPPAPLIRIAPPEVLSRWGAADRAPHAPRVLALVEDGGVESVGGFDGADNADNADSSGNPDGTGSPDGADSPDGAGESEGLGERWVGATLVTARPGTSYAKIVDAVGDVPAVVGAVVEDARAAGLAQVKWEGWTVDDAGAAALGFSRLRAPVRAADVVPPVVPAPAGEDSLLASDPGGAGDSSLGPDPAETDDSSVAGPGTRGDESSSRREDAGVPSPPAGYVRWLVDGVVREPGYYRQSTDFSCGAAASLIARAQTGALGPGGITREAELGLWRRATNFPACEPVGLGVAVRQAWPGSDVEVFLDTERPVLLGYYERPEQEWRAVLQRSSRAEAGRIGLPLEGRRLGIGDVRAAVGRGEHLLLLVSAARMQGFDVPHWILCHGAVPGAVVVEDTWTHDAAGETWVDAHLLPIPDDSLDAMSALEEDGFRGAVRIAAGR